MLALRAAGPALKRHAPAQCRRIFSFPSFQSGPEKFHESRVLPCVKVSTNSDVCSSRHDRYSQKELYAVVADVASYPKFIPFCTNSRIDKQAFERAMQGRTVVEAQLSVGFMNFTEQYTSIVTCEPFKSVQVICTPKWFPTPMLRSPRPLRLRRPRFSRRLLRNGASILNQTTLSRLWSHTASNSNLQIFFMLRPRRLSLARSRV